jgi:hypothetical protein
MLEMANPITIKYIDDDDSNLILTGIYTSPKGERRTIDLENGTITFESTK